VNLQVLGNHGPDRNGNMRIEVRFQIETYVVPAREPAEEAPDARA
jgi:hypothetical protein